MKIVLNKCYGGFSISKDAAEVLGLKSEYDYIDRTDARLVNMVEQRPDLVNGPFSNLKVVEISDETTDWEINDYDGMETVIYVYNGRLNHQ